MKTQNHHHAHTDTHRPMAAPTVPKPLSIEWLGSSQPILEHVSSDMFSPKFKLRMFTLLHLLSTGDINPDEGTFSHLFKSAVRIWKGTAQEFETREPGLQEAEQNDPAIEELLPGGDLSCAAIFKLTENVNFVNCYLDCLRGRCHSFLAKNPISKPVKAAIVAYPFGYISEVWRLAVTIKTDRHDVLSDYHELIIDYFDNFNCVLNYLNSFAFKNGGLRDDSCITGYKFVFFTQLGTLGTGRFGTPKVIAKNTKYSNAALIGTPTPSNSKMLQWLVGTITCNTSNKSAQETYFSRISTLPGNNNNDDPSKPCQQSMRITPEPEFSKNFFSACMHCEPTVRDITRVEKFTPFQDHIYATIYPAQVHFVVPSMLFSQLKAGTYETNTFKLDAYELQRMSQVRHTHKIVLDTLYSSGF